ncbi:hypothetical protein BJF78_27100 [Pseudonocardia sp. CNS-139]|nr:hypothetical protein BJF78_27100 [Pseudonocardia sp. CNS-139]
MTRPYREVPFRDELLADGTVRRAYADGRQEWRRRGAGGVVTWRDNRGRTGVDELLGGRVVKRRIGETAVLYGRDVGYGRTTWSDGVLTVNQTSAGGRAGLIIAGIGAAGLLPALVDPPFAMTPEEEEALRQQQAQQASSGSGGSGDSGGDTTVAADSDWSSSDDGTGDDFG